MILNSNKHCLEKKNIIHTMHT